MDNTKTPIVSMSETLKKHRERVEYDGGFKILPRTDEELILKQDAWIVWLCNDEGKIDDLSVFNCIEYRKEKRVWLVNKYCDGRPYYDIGCSLYDWDEWNLSDVLFKFGWQYGFKNKAIMKKSLESLSMIVEWEQEIKAYLNYFNF